MKTPGGFFGQVFMLLLYLFVAVFDNRVGRVVAPLLAVAALVAFIWWLKI